MRDLEPLIAAARRQGWRVEPTGGGHMRFRPCDPAAPLIFTASTPSDRRAISAMRAQLRRAGLDIRRAS